MQQKSDAPLENITPAELLLQMLKAYKPIYEAEVAAQKCIVAFLNQTAQPFGKVNESGHITASAWIVDAAGTQTLMTHHFKLNRWLQLGGHTEIGESVITAARREAMEESGLEAIKMVREAIFDLDVHEIPAYGVAPTHVHYDIRFMFVADPDAKTTRNRESKQLRWIPLTQIESYTREWSVLRMAEKTTAFLSD